MNRGFRKRFRTVSPAMRLVIRVAEKVLETDTSLLILGESGTGKDHLARAIHDSGTRSRGPFVPIDCSGIPESLFESELFGHEKGAFTDARTRKIGRVEQARGGSLVFEEVGSLAMPLQAKLLRLLQDRVIYRLGGQSPVEVDVRFVSTSAMKIAEMVEAGEFRKDLFYRLNVVTLIIPPLRERPEDVPGLAKSFLAAAVGRHEKPIDGFSEEAMAILVQHSWPGNIRELGNVVDRAVILEPGPKISPGSLPTDRFVKEEDLIRTAAAAGWSLETLEEHYVREILRRTGGNNTRAAATLGIHRKTLIDKRKRYGIELGRSKPESET